MSLSLKAYCRKLETLLGEPSDSIYERQRRLVDVEKMPIDQGRGPGSGVRFTADSVSWLLVAMLCADTVRGAGNLAPHYHTFLPARGGIRQKLKHGLSAVFGMALQNILAAPELAKLVDRIEVSRSVRRAVIYWKSGEPIVFEDPKHLTAAGMTIAVTLDGAVLRAIADDLDHLKDEHKAVLVSTIKA